jgi:hypothetical protein
MIKVDKEDADGSPCANDAALTCAWARESVHVGRDLWNEGDDVGYDGVGVETTDMEFGGRLGFTLYLPLLDVNLGLGGDGEDDETNDAKFATDVDAKK